MPELILIAAVGRDRVIGKDNALLWRIPADLAHFKTLTLGHPVIMGRKTWESLPEKFRPLPGRRNIVVTRNRQYAALGALVVFSLEAAIAAAHSEDGQAFIMGGAELYAQALPLATRLELTEVDASAAADAWFPPLPPGEWRESARRHGKPGDADEAGVTPRFDFVTYQRSTTASI